MVPEAQHQQNLGHSSAVFSHRLTLEFLSHSLDGVSAFGQQGLIQMLFGLFVGGLQNAVIQDDAQ